ncbi:MAG: hypothetical protein ACTJHU_10450 [Mycetocola sp.]
MTRTNRFMNRFLLGLVGVVLIAAAGAVLLVTLATPWREAARGIAAALRETVSGWVQSLTQLWSATPETVVGGAGLIVVVVVITVGLSVLFTRGGGRTRVLLTQPSSSSGLEGGVVLEPDTAADIVRQHLTARPEVVHVGSTAYRVRRRGVLVLRVQLRSGAAIGEIVRSAEESVRSIDVFLGEQMPVVLEFVEGARARFSSDTRTSAVPVRTSTGASRVQPVSGQALASSSAVVDSTAESAPGHPVAGAAS